jgi:hypothetical protein
MSDVKLDEVIEERHEILKGSSKNEKEHTTVVYREAHENVEHINLSWRSWVAVFIACFA